MKRLLDGARYANVTSTLALIVALGGTSYAAIRLPANSVGSAQIKRNGVAASDIRPGAVTGAAVKGESLDGSDIEEATLSTVPTAALASLANSATNAANASSLANQPASAYARVAQPEFTPLAPAPGFSNAAGGFAPLSFLKDTLGFVHLRGTMDCPAQDQAPAFALPPGARPVESLLVPIAAAAGAAHATIEPSGVVRTHLDGGGGLCAFDGISFRAGQ